MASRKGTFVRVVLALGLTAVAVLAFVGPHRARPRVAPTTLSPDPVAVPRPAPSLEHATREGLIALGAPGLFDRIRRTHANGVVVNAWASWCGSCKGDFPVLLGLRKTLGADIELMLVSVDEESSLPAAAEMLQGFGALPPNFIVDQPLDQFKPALNPKWPGMLPATFLFDPAGKLRYFWGGPVREDEIVPLLRRYLAGEHIDGEADFALAPGAVTR
jgi:cytochrome c biogenesis protein CcmG/thiol:disulfide interchange protein DsbE